MPSPTYLIKLEKVYLISKEWVLRIWKLSQRGLAVVKSFSHDICSRKCRKKEFLIVRIRTNIFYFVVELKLPMNKCSFCKHEIKLIIQPCPCFHDCCCVGKATNSTCDFSQISTWYNCWGLIINTNLQKKVVSLFYTIFVKSFTEIEHDFLLR